jgi:hypothetical protein
MIRIKTEKSTFGEKDESTIFESNLMIGSTIEDSVDPRN